MTINTVVRQHDTQSMFVSTIARPYDTHHGHMLPKEQSNEPIILLDVESNIELQSMQQPNAADNSNPATKHSRNPLVCYLSSNFYTSACTS